MTATNNPWPTAANEQAHRLQIAKWCALHKLAVPSGPVVDAFVVAMGANQYGVEETWDAFCWFREGWEAMLGTLKCPACDGSGQYLNRGVGLPSEGVRVPCRKCNATGKHPGPAA